MKRTRAGKDKEKAEELIKKLKYPIGVPYEFRYRKGKRDVVVYFMNRLAPDFPTRPFVYWNSNPGSAALNVSKQFFNSKLKPLSNAKAREVKGEMMELLQCNIVGLYARHAQPVTDVATLAELALCGLEVDAAEIQRRRIREAVARLDRVQDADDLERAADAIESAVKIVL